MPHKYDVRLRPRLTDSGMRRLGCNLDCSHPLTLHGKSADRALPLAVVAYQGHNAALSGDTSVDFSHVAKSMADTGTVCC